ncbi:MAG: gamma-glutamyl-gamma-aminobutyrate hydrolase family protein [Candidatus Edwardsbacteria bacterium]|nr:gamma-glutamyl-gamma-aminobutyrate hydrolase family protein [Candidatus Edwardsbacteria bacterium]
MKKNPLHPIIGLTALRSPDRESFHHMLTGHYLRAITAAGGFPIVLPAMPERCAEALDLVSGLLLIGGGDIEGKHLGKPTHPRAKFFNPLRDVFELAIIPKAIGRKMPLLGICRGEQLINVAMGGTLYQDIGDEQGSSFEHLQEDKPDQAVHAVSVAPESCLAAILGTTQVSVNSTHHQAVREPAPKLRAVAWAPDGVIEGIESCSPETGFILGVQWHPERLVENMPEHRRLFQRFVKAAEHFQG